MGFKEGTNGSSGSSAWGNITGILSNQLDLDTRFKLTEEQWRYYEIFESTSTNTGTLTIPTESQILLGRYPSGVSAICVTLDGNGRPLDEIAREADLTPVTVSLDISGNFVLSGTPVPTPVGIVYEIRIQHQFSNNVPESSILNSWSISDSDHITSVDSILPYGANLTQVVQTIQENNPGILFDSLLAPPAFEEGKLFYDGIDKSFNYYAEITGVRPTRIGRTLRSRIYNDEPDTLVKGTVIKISGVANGAPKVKRAQANSINDVKSTIGMVMADILPGEIGYSAVFDVIFGVDTSSALLNDLVYLSPDTPGGFTFEEPKSPYYSLPFGFVSFVDNVNGVISVRFGGYSGTDTSTNIEGFLNGTITQTPSITVLVSGGIIYADIANEHFPTKNLPLLFDGKRYDLDVTNGSGVNGAYRVIIPPGASSTQKQRSLIYVYLNNGVPAIGVSSTEPVIPFIEIAYITVFDAARTLSDGRAFGVRRYNNAIDFKDGSTDGSNGGFVETINTIRFKLGSNWLSGQTGTPVVNDTTIRLQLSSGKAAQFRKSITPIFDGLSYIIYNNSSNLATYQVVNNLTSIVTSASGESLLGNNVFYTLRCFYMLNSKGTPNNVIVTRPLSYYTTANEAIQDAQNYSTSIADTDIEEITYPLYDLVIGRTGGGGTTISLIKLVDRRTRLPGGTGGGVGSSSGGILTAPNLSTIERDALTPSNGMIIYNTTTSVFNFFENGLWTTK